MAFAIGPGEILGLIGPNGSGKSTVMKLIMGIERPNAGSVRASAAPRSRAGRRTASPGTAWDSCSSTPARSGARRCWRTSSSRCCPTAWSACSRPATSNDRAREIAARVGLETVVADRLPATLPFADLRRLELARAIARNPRVVLVDEPFAGLTAGEVADFSALIASFRADGPRRAAGRSQREGRRRAGGPRARDVSRRVRGRGLGGRGDAQRDRAPRLSRRRHRDRRPQAGGRRRPRAAAGGGRRERAVRQGPGAGCA